MTRALRRLLKYRHLEIIDALVRHRSLTRASQGLGVSQPALTRALREIETLIGERLFDRHPRGLAPTAAGMALAEFARQALSDVSQLEATLDHASSAQAPPVTLGALPVAAAGLLPVIVGRLQELQPKLGMTLVEGRTEDLLARLDLGEVDLILGRLYPPALADGFHRTVLYAEPISLLVRAGHPLLQQEQPSPSDLARHIMVLPTFSQRVALDIAGFLQAIGVEPKASNLASTSISFIREMVLQTDAIAVMPRLMVAGDLARGQVRAIDLHCPMPARPAGIITNPRRGLTSGAEILIRTLRATISEMAGSGLVDII